MKNLLFIKNIFLLILSTNIFLSFIKPRIISLDVFSLGTNNSKKIYLFGDNHYKDFEEETEPEESLGLRRLFEPTDKKGKEQIRSLLKNLSTENEQNYIFVEDFYNTAKRSLKSLDTEKEFHGVLMGLIQRINALGKKNLHVINIEQRLIIGRAILFFNYANIPPFCELNFADVLCGKEVNYFSITFQDLLSELERLVSEHIDMFCSGTYQNNIFRNYFLNQQVMLTNYYFKFLNALDKFKIYTKESILAKAIDFFLDDLKDNSTQQFQTKLEELRLNFFTFVCDYPYHMNQNEYDTRSTKLKSDIIEYYKNFVQHMVFYKNMQRYKTFKKLLNIGKVLADCYILLNIYPLIQKSEGNIFLFAGKDHTDKIKDALTQLGFKKYSENEIAKQFSIFFDK